MNAITEIEKLRAIQIKTICIGIISSNMGYADQSCVVNAGNAVFEKICNITFKEFRILKKIAKTNNELERM